MQQGRVIAGDTQQAEAHDQHAGNGTAAERHLQRRIQPALGGLGGAHVRAYRDVHADEAGQAGEKRADRKADRGFPGLEAETNQEEQDDADQGNGRVLAVQVGLSAFLHGRSDFLHAGVASRFGGDPAIGKQPIQQGRAGTQE